MFDCETSGGHNFVSMRVKEDTNGGIPIAEYKVICTRCGKELKGVKDD